MQEAESLFSVPEHPSVLPEVIQRTLRVILLNTNLTQLQLRFKKTIGNILEHCYSVLCRFGPIEYRGPFVAPYMESFILRVITPLTYLPSTARLKEFLSNHEV